MIRVLLMLLWLFCLPRHLFEDVPYSTVVTGSDGELLGVRVAADGQWRFPMGDTIPDKFAKALIEFEDRRFYAHGGVSVRALARAAVQNLRAGRVVSGGSTLTMQLVRLSRRAPRTLWQKVVEAFLATRLEVCYSKDEILQLYAAYAPFGGNVVGIRAAMWRYLGSDKVELSWAEAATLAVLQNSPSLVRPGRRSDVLLAKRNRLLARLHEKGELTDADYALAVREPLIGTPRPMPQHALHWVEHFHRTAPGAWTATSIDLALQQRVEELADQWCRTLRQQHVRDVAVVVAEVKSGRFVAYVGNADPLSEREGRWVDMARADRSSGSILKPLLYAAALQEGRLLPQALLPDVPTDFGGFAPKNFDGTYAGAVRADEALALSLNVPSVHLLQSYGVGRFVRMLQQAGFSSLHRPASDYGLSLVLGGAEVRLTDVVACYARMAACYADSSACPGFPLRDRVALYHTFRAMREVGRPDQVDWHRAVSVRPVAWKTGTSYGSRDAWAVGVTPTHVVGVWAGCADGSGVSGLTGARHAAPLLFDVFSLLPPSEWFAEPDSADGRMVRVCRRSGHRAGRCCTETEACLLPDLGAQGDVCPYCTEVLPPTVGHLTGCVESRFVLPPLMEQFYAPRHPEYSPLPSDASLSSASAGTVLQIVYPAEGSTIRPARGLDGTYGRIVCRATHTSASARLFWHLDDAYIGSTERIHRMPIQPSAGCHTLTVVDGQGRFQSVRFVAAPAGVEAKKNK